MFVRLRTMLAPPTSICFVRSILMRGASGEYDVGWNGAKETPPPNEPGTSAYAARKRRPDNPWLGNDGDHEAFAEGNHSLRPSVPKKPLVTRSSDAATSTCPGSWIVSVTQAFVERMLKNDSL